MKRIRIAFALSASVLILYGAPFPTQSKTRNACAWELPFYTNKSGFPLFRVTLPPFPGLEKNLTNEKITSDDIWRFLTKDYAGNVHEDLISVNTLKSDPFTLFADFTLNSYIPHRPLEKIGFGYRFRSPPAPDYSRHFRIIAPMTWADTSVFINGERLYTLSDAEAKDNERTREWKIPYSALRKDDVNTFEAVIYLSNYNEALYAWHNDRSVSVKYTVSNISPYAEGVHVVYRRTDYYFHTFFHSTLSPFPVIQTMWKSIFLSGLAHEDIEITQIGFIGESYYTRSTEATVIYDLERDGPLVENYVILFGANKDGQDFPLLLTFNLPLLRIMQSAEGELKFDFPLEPLYTYLTLVPLAASAEGISARAREHLTHTLPQSLHEKCEIISRMSFLMPVTIREKNTLRVDSFKYLRFETLIGESFPRYVPFHPTLNYDTNEYSKRTLHLAGERYEFCVPRK